jgi:hypothetical protein
LERIRPPIARAVRNRQGTVVDDVNEAGGIAFGRYVHSPSSVTGGDEYERRLGDECSTTGVQESDLFLQDTVARVADHGPKLFLGRHNVGKPLFS